MADLTLGLDLGSSSIGWALIDEHGGAIHAAGVRVFPEGVDRDTKGGELSKNESRRVARSMRRQIARRSRRKLQLRAALVAAGMLPADPVEQAALDQVDPYDLRRRALTEKLMPHEIGRAMIHLNQRRGFKSNRRADKARKKENSDMLAEISALEKEIQDAGHRTLGEHLATQVAKPGEIPLTRVRGKHTRRPMFEREFDAIWEAQRKHHPLLLTELLREKVRRIIFFQREMYWPASVVGRCELDPRLPRCSRADRRAQRFRLLNEVNNLRLLDTTTGEERRLTDEERAHLIALLAKTKELKFDVIRKKMGFLESVRFNLERGDRGKLKGMVTDAAMAHKNLFGKAWYVMSDDDRDRVVAAVISADEGRIRFVGEQLKLAPDLIDRLIEEELEDGYVSYSLHAIKRLLPHLEAGLPLSSRDGSICALIAAKFQRPWDQVPNPREFLGDPEKDHDIRLTNPLVRAALHEVRKVVNAVLRELVYRFGHRLARINIELAREVKGTLAERQRRSLDNREREGERDEAANKLREHGVKPTRDGIDRYRLWLEQDKRCVYSGQPISLTQLVGGEVDVDHILPYPRSLDNSFMNRVVCFRTENAVKADQTPHEWLAERNSKKYEQVLQRADRLPYPKAQRFRCPSVQLDDFFARQFVDTTYITSQVAHYIRCLGADVVCTKGQHTAELRQLWGMNTILRDDGLNLKNREDHRHHAVDAIVIALTNRRRLQLLADYWKQQDRGNRQAPNAPRLDVPWPDFRAEAERMVNSINVSHRSRRKIKGALHEETIYGPTENAGEFVVRKPVDQLTLSMIDDIRDDGIKKIIVKRLNELKIDPAGTVKPPKDWARDLRMKSGVPVRKVRLIRRDQTIQPIRTGAYVKPGSLHHACLFEMPDGKRDAVYVTMLEAIRRQRRREEVVRRVHPDVNNARFLMSITPGDMLLAKFGGSEQLVVASTLVSTQKRVHIVAANDARPSAEKKNEGKTPNSLDARKVIVDPIGRLRWAND